MKNKIIFLLVITCVMLALMISNVYAADSYTVKLDASTETVLPGGTVVLHVTVPKIDVEKGIGTLTGTIEYDKTVFEVIGTKDVKNKEDWESVTFNPNNGAFVTLTLSGDTLKESTEVFDITLKVLNTAKAGETQIKLSNISSSDGDKDIETADVTKKITIKEKSENTTTNNTNNTNNTNTAKKNNNVTVLPYAGENDMIILVVGLLLAFGVIGYFKLKSLKEI